MRALSLHQPWASLVAHGCKTLETRDWGTDYRGPLAVHASKRWTQDQHARWLEFSHALGPSRFPALAEWKPPRRRVLEELPPLGAVVCLATVTACGRFSVLEGGTLPTFQGHLVSIDDVLAGDTAPGRFGWKLERVLRLDEPYPMVGRQGLWTPEAADRAALAVAKGWWIDGGRFDGPAREDDPSPVDARPRSFDA